MTKAAPGNLSPRDRAVFERRHRLLNGNQFKSVFDFRQRFHGTFFSVHFMPNQGACHRLGMAVSRKVSKKAVERNRIKRQVRESFRLFNSAPRPVSQSAPLFMDIVVVAKPSAASAGNGLIRTELDRVWLRAAGALSDKRRLRTEASAQ